MDEDVNISGDLARFRKCLSFQQFRLTAEVIGWSFPVGLKTFELMYEDALDRKACGFLDVLAEAVSRGYFDTALDETEFYQDYYVAAAVDRNIDPRHYAHYLALEHILNCYDVLSMLRADGRNSPVFRFVKAVIKRIRSRHGDSPSIDNAKYIFDRTLKRRRSRP